MKQERSYIKLSLSIFLHKIVTYTQYIVMHRNSGEGWRVRVKGGKKEEEREKGERIRRRK